MDLSTGIFDMKDLIWHKESFVILIIIIFIIINIYCNLVVTRWQWLLYTYTKYEIVY